jgi:hypothetical protein
MIKPFWVLEKLEVTRKSTKNTAFPVLPICRPLGVKIFTTINTIAGSYS